MVGAGKFPGRRCGGGGVYGVVVVVVVVGGEVDGEG